MNIKYRRTVIAANWKMNMLPSEIKGFSDDIKPLTTQVKRCDIIICPSSVLIPAVLKAFRDSRISVGAQDMSAHESGAYTGEVSANQLTELGVHYVIIGHSERRQNFGEDDLSVNAKVHAALSYNLRPIICVGESLRQRDMGMTTDLVTLQVKAALAGVPDEKIRRTIIAYEPIWAIGTGKTASAEEAGSVAETIRSVIRGLYGARSARAIPIIYGGSMNETNASSLLSQPDIDGGLIGGASLSPEKFAAIIAASNQDIT